MQKSRHAKSQGTPDDYRPETPADLIGPARAIAQSLIASLPHYKRLKLLLCGTFGAGKTTIAQMIARQLAAGAIDIEKVNGRNLTIEVVRQWQQSSCYGSLFGGWKVKLIEEADLIPQLAQDLMLTYLDELPERTAVIGSSNLDLATLTERFQTRFELAQVDPPEADELAAWLVSKWKVPRATANFIAAGSCGNVRAALLDANSFRTFGSVRRRPKTPTVVIDPTKSEASKRAWQTMRGRKAA
jgi:chromosomal replication initiation ATPase DnaA